MPDREPAQGDLPSAHLEPGQLAANRSRPVPRARLSPAARIALWALRIFVLLIGTMVIYVFVSQLL